MAFTSNGQVQYLILDSLSEGAKYGLEIIEYITKKTEGNYILKKPTLYSCLTRLEKKGYISSSFWGESEFGGKRHYYALTKEGKENLELLRKEFAGINFAVLAQEENEASEPEETVEPLETEKPIFLEQKNLFDLSKQAEPAPAKIENEEEKSEVVDNQIDFFTFQHEVEENEKDDGRFLDANETLTPIQKEQNKKIYDSSSELKKYRNRRSFSDNQIEMPVVYEKEDDHFSENVARLKESLLASKQKHSENVDYSNYVNKSTEKDIYSKEINQEILPADEEVKDDAKFITEKLEYIPYQKRITPPNIEINVSDENLPAPMRDSKLEPTYNDMVSKVMEKKEENKVTKEEKVVERSVKVERPTNNIADYESLKEYYSSHGLEFKEYKHTVVERMHNTNFLKFFASLILFALSGMGCGLIYVLTLATDNLMPTSNFLYYTVPALFAVYAIVLFIKYTCAVSRKATLKYNAIVNWVVFLLASVVVFVVNVCFGMTAETMASYLTSLLVPILAMFLIFPANYFITKLIFKKYAK